MRQGLRYVCKVYGKRMAPLSGKEIRKVSVADPEH